MIIPYVIFSISTLTWLLVPFRQYKGEYFMFFLIIGLMDPITVILNKTLHTQPISLYIIFIFLAILTLLGLNVIRKNIALIIVLFAGSIFIAFFVNIKYMIIYLALLHLMIFIIFLSRTIFDIYKDEFINVFYFVICVYEISIIIKFMVSIIDLKTGIILFYLTSAFEILVGLYFILYNEKNSPKIKLNREVI
jgi:hypothetical protein